MDWSQKVSQKGIESSERQNRAMLQSIIDNSRQEQRAWVGITFPNLDRAKEFSKDGGGTVFQCPTTITNYGRTPAHMVQIHAICALLPLGSNRLDLGPNGPKPHTEDIFEFIQPTQINHLPIPAAIVLNGEVAAIPGTEELWNEVAAAKFTVIVYGNLTYTDSFSKSHWTHFCHAYNADNGGPESCLHYNDSDQTAP